MPRTTSAPQKSGRSSNYWRTGMDKELFADLLASVKEMQQIRAGKLKPGRVTFIEPKLDVKAAREKTGLSQADFASILQVSKGTLLNWEQGRRAPTGPA